MERGGASSANSCSVGVCGVSFFEVGEECGERDVGADAAVELVHYRFGAGFDSGAYGWWGGGGRGRGDGSVVVVVGDGVCVSMWEGVVVVVVVGGEGDG